MLPTTQTRTNLTTTQALITEQCVPQALAAQVAAQQGVTLSTPGVTWTCCHNATGYHVIVTVDHEARGAQAAAANKRQAAAFQDPIHQFGPLTQASAAHTPATYWQQYATGLGGSGQGFLGGGVNQETSQQQPGAALQGTQGLTRDAEMDCAAHQQARGAAWQHQAAPTTQQQPPMTLPERIERDKQRAFKAPWPFPPNPAPNAYGRR